MEFGSGILKAAASGIYGIYSRAHGERRGMQRMFRGCSTFFSILFAFFFLHASLPFLLEVIKYLKELFVLEGRLWLCELGLL